jgi:hypothetical protein
MDKLLEDLKPYVYFDSNGIGGWYLISSIYFENKFNKYYYDTMNRLEFRQKLRLRVYGECTSSSVSYFELKMKIKGLVLKRRVSMMLSDALEFAQKCYDRVDFDVELYPSSSSQILREIKHVIQMDSLLPCNVVSYDRLALIAKDNPDVRITFDTKIRTRDTDVDLTHGAYGDPVIDEDKVELELKSSGNLPIWLVKIIEKYDYRNLMFSKYCSHYNFKKGDKENAG